MFEPSSAGKAKVDVCDGQFVANFCGNSGKSYCDKGELYNAQQCEAVMEVVLRPNKSSRGRRRSNANLLSLQSLSERHPPMLWSLYVIHGRSVASVIQEIVKRLES